MDVSGWLGACPLHYPVSPLLHLSRTTYSEDRTHSNIPESSSFSRSSSVTRPVGNSIPSIRISPSAPVPTTAPSLKGTLTAPSPTPSTSVGVLNAPKSLHYSPRPRLPPPSSLKVPAATRTSPSSALARASRSTSDGVAVQVTRLVTSSVAGTVTHWKCESQRKLCSESNFTFSGWSHGRYCPVSQLSRLSLFPLPLYKELITRIL